MKVIFLTWEYPPNVYGGAGVHVRYLTETLARHIRIEVKTPLTGKTSAKSEKGTIEVLRYEPWDFLQQASSPGTEILLKAFSVNLAFVRDLIECDIVHSHTWYTNLAGFYAKELYDVKLVATVHSLEPKRPWKSEAMGKAYRLSSWAENIGLNACDKVIAVSKEDKNDIMECYGIEEQRIEVIPNGIDIKKFRRRENPSILKKYLISKPYVLFLGRLSRQKGVFDAVEASSSLPKGVKLVVVTGKADEIGLEEELDKKVKSAGNILWINKMLSEAEIIALYSSCSVFVSPSIYEPFGIMNLEAMACSKPVVSTKVGGIKDVVVDGATGFLVSPGSSGELADAINRILADENLAERMGRTGRKTVEREFSWERVAEKTLNLYKKML
ncbi:MAG: alpha-maltose-phosphate synthase [Thermoproteota archaeon]|nr:alpha-maltose-phosphate synthase [Thermoproteota archaeon]